MISQVLEEIAKRCIDFLVSSSYGTIILSAAFILLASFTLLNHNASDSSTITTLREPVFLVIASLTVFIAALLVLRQSNGVPRYIAIVILLLIAAIETAIYWQFKTPEFQVDIVLDDTINPSSGFVTKLLGVLNQPHFQPALLDKRINFNEADDKLFFGDAVSALTQIKKTRSNSTHTLLITHRRLFDSKWQNLFYSIQGRIAVISIFGIGTQDDRLNDPLVERYLAAMITLATLHSEASTRFRTLLPDRSPISEHGCIHDFSSDRRLLVEKLRQDIGLCPSEAMAITSVFGSAITTEFRTILARAGKPNTLIPNQ
ncbi:MAG: hypothetical protein Q7U98_02320 [Methylicorpusculum sp.]|uniref:hypothetical protein n=1 Tax=Methylicorpusculum sp. TaxID=2713644 RepID=UPI002717A8AD|nr:hypothetical protein [Methylicorpusculum sp.]MDO8937973.1 hypothetical protein [Methylicorpusculum sp.]MDO9241471.1 hypothetical protein [Methylicorpusculum sp.]MDP2180760.1 hypothetical protein [Methylicorpusculum sp.]MDP2202659.1 hypothetical protein [Methylicorpusculum sp.]